VPTFCYGVNKLVAVDANRGSTMDFFLWRGTNCHTSAKKTPN
jgi:hypothetical protein